jgi:hypothetical protein
MVLLNKVVLVSCYKILYGSTYSQFGCWVISLKNKLRLLLK